MKIKITLENAPGCELSSETIEVADGGDADDHSHQIESVITGWTLSVGDTITIREV